MLDIIDKIITVSSSGGPQAIIAILFLIIIGLLHDRHFRLDEIKAKDAKLDRIIDDYFKGTMTIAEALNSLKIVLYELRASIK